MGASAYEYDPDLPYPAVLVLGPFMSQEKQAEFLIGQINWIGFRR